MSDPRKVQALLVRQWLDEWNGVRFTDEEGERRRKPMPEFFIFTLPARELWRLSNIYRRQAVGPRINDEGIQRELRNERTKEIWRFIRGGFPWSTISEKQRQSEEYQDIQMPGWLPTAIIANILPAGVERQGQLMRDEDIISIEALNGSGVNLILPSGLTNEDWQPPVRPLEIIDGQHRLSAFEVDADLSGTYDLPVVAFYNLDITWQAYLFYTINIKPTKINTSLAYDLYPILRIQEWLEKSPKDGVKVYQETRAQELTEVLWSQPESPWRGRINMLGGRQGGDVSQAAFIRSLLASYVKGGKGGRGLGGLYGSELLLGAGTKELLRWNRVQQAAFLVQVWSSIKRAIAESQAEWAEALRGGDQTQPRPLLEGARDTDMNEDPAFKGKASLLATDQGVRAILQVTNDICILEAPRLGLSEWQWVGQEAETIDSSLVTEALASLRDTLIEDFLTRIAGELANFDWRTTKAPGLTEVQRINQMAFRGSGGYKELRRQLLVLLANCEDTQIREAASALVA